MKSLAEHTLKNYKINGILIDILRFITAVRLPFRSNASRDYIEITGICKTRRTTYIYPKSDRAENYTGIT